jgi:hypothetical protein
VLQEKGWNHQVGRSAVCPRFSDNAHGEGCSFARPVGGGHAAIGSRRLLRAGRAPAFFHRSTSWSTWKRRTSTAVPSVRTRS